MNTINAISIDRETPTKYEELQIKTGVCRRCKKPYDGRAIMFVTTSYGKVIWWHRRNSYHGFYICDDENYEQIKVLTKKKYGKIKKGKSTSKSNLK